MKWDVWWRSVQDNVSARLLRSLYLSIVLPSVFSRNGCSMMLQDLKAFSCLSLRFSSNPLCPEVLFLAPGVTPIEASTKLGGAARLPPTAAGEAVNERACSTPRKRSGGQGGRNLVHNRRR